MFQANGTAERDAALIMLEKRHASGDGGQRQGIRHARLRKRLPESARDPDYVSVCQARAKCRGMESHSAEGEKALPTEVRDLELVPRLCRAAWNERSNLVATAKPPAAFGSRC